MTSTLSEVEPSPVFVDQSGRRGRRLRGAGWVFGVAFVGVTLAMASGLLGTQSDAPSFAVPDTADTQPPGEYVNAPLPAPPGKADRSKGVPRTASPTATATPTGTPTATGSPTATPSADGSATATSTPTAGRTGNPPAGSTPSTHPTSSSPAPSVPETPPASATPPPTESTPTDPAVPNTTP